MSVDPVATALDDTLGTDCDEWKPDRHKRVSSVMHGAMPLVTSGMRMDGTIDSMTAGKFGCVGVVDSGGQLMGIITDGDLRRHIAVGLLYGTAADVMTWRPISIGKDMFIDEALALMNERKITVVFVVDGDTKPIGIVHVHDLLAASA